VYREVYLAAPREVLDVTVTAMFGSAGDCTGAFFADLLFEGGVCGPCVDTLGLGGLSDGAFQFGGGNELGFALVPFCEDFGGGGAA
jgi:hypothetical protein